MQSMVVMMRRVTIFLKWQIKTFWYFPIRIASGLWSSDATFLLDNTTADHTLIPDRWRHLISVRLCSGQKLRTRRIQKINHTSGSWSGPSFNLNEINAANEANEAIACPEISFQKNWIDPRNNFHEIIWEKVWYNSWVNFVEYFKKN